MTAEITPVGCRRLGTTIVDAKTSDQSRGPSPAASPPRSEEDVERLVPASSWPRARAEPNGHDDH
jgi:hypothetical protein